ncbi:hypothetical protein N2W29_002641 [Clostridium perfringens]|nr:hypothetical protein [Clostridium perfringens]WEV15731.1 hypothetical protein PL325_14000 [Clostridium perfringens D]
MKLYKIYNKNNIRNIFFNEKIMVPHRYINKFYDYKEEIYNENEWIIELYSRIPVEFLKQDDFLIELEINLKYYNYDKKQDKYIFFNDLYLDDKNINLNKIFYFSEEIYRIILPEIFLIAEAKLFSKYKSKFKYFNLQFNSLNYKNEEKQNLNISCNKLNEVEEKKGVIFDSLKGAIYLMAKFYPKILINNSIEKKEVNKILNLRNAKKIIDLEIDDNIDEKNRINTILNKAICKRKTKIKKYIFKNKNNIFILKQKNNYNISLNKKIFKLNINELKLINKIINLIIECKKNKVNNINEYISVKLGEYCKETKDKNLYNDCKILYCILIQRKLGLNYKDINNNTIKFLYLALEYRENLSSINSIISDYKFNNYHYIYMFIGLLNGFERLNKLYVDNQNLDVFEEKVHKELDCILKKIDKIYNINNFYIEDNHRILSNMSNGNFYYKLVELYNIKNNNKLIRFERRNSDLVIIKIYNKYNIFLNKKVAKKYFKFKNIKTDKYFICFKYCKVNGEKLTYSDEIDLNSKLNEVIRK